MAEGRLQRESSMITELLLEDPVELQRIMHALSMDDRIILGKLLDDRIKNPMFAYRGDHHGFVVSGLREGTWSGQDEILKAVDKYTKVVVIGTHGFGKSHISARVVLGTGSTWPVGLARITTTATTFRQVANVLWPYIRRTHVHHNLPGIVSFSPQWKIGDELIADGFSSANSDETATQGMHANGEMLLVVDEAGGISDTLGGAFNALLSNPGAHALVIGNAPTDRENSWFERICQPGSGWHVIRVSAFDTPAFTGEVTGWCTVCPDTIEKHRVSTHLTSRDWVQSVKDEFGTDSAFYIARVLAQFPRNVISKTLPLGWLEIAQVDPAGENVPDLDTWRETLPVRPLRLGCDIASDGGDELVVAIAQGVNGWVANSTSGPAIGSARQAAQFILAEINKAEEWHERHDIKDPVVCKLDSIGIGWGVQGLLEEYGDQGRHHAVIVGVNVAETASEPEKYMNQRAEMWWSFRTWIEPVTDTGEVDPMGKPILDTIGKFYMGMRELAQLNAPGYSVKNGRIAIEKKEDMRKRGQRSPDRAEAILIALFEPPRKTLSVPSVGDDTILMKENEWNLDVFS